MSTYDSWNGGALSKPCRQLGQHLLPQSLLAQSTALEKDLVNLTNSCFPRQTSVYSESILQDGMLQLRGNGHLIRLVQTKAPVSYYTTSLFSGRVWCVRFPHPRGLLEFQDFIKAFKNPHWLVHSPFFDSL